MTSVVSVEVAALTEGVIKAMLLTKLKTAIVVLVAVGLLGLASVMTTHDSVKGGQVDPKSPDAPQKNGDGAKGQLKPTVFSVGEYISTLAWDGTSLATGSYILENGSQTSTLRLWDVQKGKEKVAFGSDTQSTMESMVFSPDGKTLAVKVERYSAADLDSLKSYVRIVDVSKGETTHTVVFPGPCGGVAFSPDGKTLAFGGADSYKTDFDSGALVVKLWDVEKGKEKQEFKWDAPAQMVNGVGAASRISSIRFSPDGKTLAVATFEGGHKIKLLNAHSGKLTHTLEGQAMYTLTNPAMAFAPDGKTLVSAGEDQKIQVWDPDTGTLQRTLVGNKGRVYSVAFSPDGKTLATSGQIVEDKKYSGEVLLWDAQSGLLRRTLPGYESSYPGVVAFSRDGTTLAVGSRGGAKDGKVRGEVKLWRLSELLDQKK